MKTLIRLINQALSTQEWPLKTIVRRIMPDVCAVVAPVPFRTALPVAQL
ncbi:hypothetical protein Z949_995 [Sulfitobacter guttiformis KCTC 32187]|nr:hypothetical protein Z949_995 [Sulfitobacter guttiformis KCTC 32187]